MNFQYEPKEYMGQLEAYSELDETKFSSSESRDEVIAKLHWISFRKKQVADVQNRIIEEYIERFEKGREVLDPKAAETLRQMLDSMFPVPQYCADASVGIRLCRLLFDYYQKEGDLENTALVIDKGTVCEVLLSFYVDDHDFLSFPKQGEAYLPVLDKLSPDAQYALLHAYSYRILVKSDEGLKKGMELFAEVERILNDHINTPADQGRLGRTLFAAHHNILGTFCEMCRIDADCIKHERNPIFCFDLEKWGEKLTNCVRIIEDGIGNNRCYDFNPIFFKVDCLQAKFHLGLIGFTEYQEKMDELIRLSEALTEESKVTILLYVNAMYLTYLYKCSPYPDEEVERLSRERINQVMPMITELKDSGKFQYQSMVLLFLGAVSFTGDFMDFYEIVLDFTVYSDKALYVHTVMVKEISHLLVSRILEKMPEYFSGVNGWDVSYIRNHREEVLSLMDDCAMCHDIGKHFLLDIVSNSSRRLTDDEFKIIKFHPGNFEEVYQKKIAKKSRFACIRDCALLHHRWHDEKGGYPELPHTNNRPFVDVLSIADSLDAATDSIGRPYGTGKTLDDLIREFLNMGGTRYSKEVAECLAEKEMREAVSELITKRREEINYRVYAFNRV